MNSPIIPTKPSRKVSRRAFWEDLICGILAGLLAGIIIALIIIGQFYCQPNESIIPCVCTLF